MHSVVQRKLELDSQVPSGHGTAHSSAAHAHIVSETLCCLSYTPFLCTSRGNNKLRNHKVSMRYHLVSLAWSLGSGGSASSLCSATGSTLVAPQEKDWLVHHIIELEV